MNALIISNVLLWMALIVLVVIVIALARQIGVLFERVAPAGALMLNSRLQVGKTAPGLVLDTITGESVAIGIEASRERSQLLFFLSPDCPLCGSFLPIIKAGAKSEQSWLDVILASDGEEMDHKKYVEKQGLLGFPYLVSRELGINYGVAKLPYAVLVDGEGKIAAMGIVNSREHLDSLFVAKERKVASIQDYFAGNRPKTAGDQK